jgi:fermentation-respiration switch protein FrsA (DUF1100 family)
VAKTVLPFGHWFVWGFDSASKIGRVKAPVLFLHGDRDTIVPHRLGEELFRRANEPKRFVTVPGADHNDLAETAGPLYVTSLREFYRAVADGI